MLHQIIKIIKAERRSNFWIWIEMFIVCSLLWFVTDYALTSLRAWIRPMNFNIEHVYRLTIGKEVDSPQKDMDQDLKMENTLNLIKAYPGVESACIIQYGGHYSNFTKEIGYQLDTVTLKGVNERYVTPEYFKVFQVYGADGSSPEKMSERFQKLRANEMQQDFFLSRSALDYVEKVYKEGRESDSRYIGMSDTVSYELISIIDGIQTNKKIEYNQTLKGIIPDQPETELGQINFVSIIPITEQSYSSFIYLRVSPEADSPNFKNEFIKRMKAVTKGSNANFSIMDIFSVKEDRAEKLSDPLRQLNNHFAIGFFLLLNIFLGIVGTFWVRTEQRRAEVGIRRVVGSTNHNILSLMFGEGALLMTLAFIPASIVAWYVMFQTDLNNITVFSISWGRLLLGLGCTYLIMLLLVFLGTFIPVSRALKVPPTEAIRDE